MGILTKIIKNGFSADKPLRDNLSEKEQELEKREKALQSEEDLCRIYMINPDRICPSPNQPREDFDEVSIVALADSIRQLGIIQPLSVRRINSEKSPLGGLYELIAGERRLRAAKLLALPYVPCIIIEAEPPVAAQLTLTENIQRSDLNMFEEAAAIASFCRNFGYSQQEAARSLSVSQAYIANKLRLLKLTGEEKSLILKHRLTERHARTLLRINGAQERLNALNYIIRREMNVKQTEDYVDSLCESQNSSTHGSRKIVIKDIRIFLNTIDRAVGIVKQAGIPIEHTRCDDGGMIELTIRVPTGQTRET